MKKNHDIEVRLTEARVEQTAERDWSGLAAKREFWPHSPWRAFGLAFQAR